MSDNKKTLSDTDKALSEADRPVRSPCISICALDKNDICLGCYRSADEITDWTTLSEQDKRQVLKNAGQRLRDAGLPRFD